MPLNPLFAGQDSPDDRAEGKAVLQRWPIETDDFARSERGDPTLVPEITNRKETSVIQLADYDRDGSATEFLVQVGTAPCGKLEFAAIGISRTDNHFRALTTVASPDKPLVMPRSSWEALRNGAGPTAVTTWPCGDHGSDTRTELVVSATDGRIQVKERHFDCGGDGKLMDEKEL